MRWRSTPDRPRRSGPGSSWHGSSWHRKEAGCRPARPVTHRPAVTSATSAGRGSAVPPAPRRRPRTHRRSSHGRRSHGDGSHSRRSPASPARSAGRPGQAGSASPVGSTSMRAGPRGPPRRRGLCAAGTGTARLQPPPGSRDPARQLPVGRRQRPASGPRLPVGRRQRVAGMRQHRAKRLRRLAGPPRRRGRRWWPATARTSRR